MTERIDIRDLPNDYILKPLGSGVTANAFLTKDNMVFKKYKPYWGEYLEDKAIELSYFDDSHFTFPKQLVYLNKEFIGYIKNYAKGKVIDNLDDAINMKKMIVALKELELHADILSQDLSFIDLSGENMLYDEDENKMTIIDTDLFEKVNNGILHRGSQEIYTKYDNRRWISGSFYKYTRDLSIDDKLDYMFRQISSINMYGYSTASDMLLEYIKQLELHTKREIQTIGDYNNCIKLVKEI